MINIRDLRRDPDGFFVKLARKGAEHIGRELFQVDAAWRAATVTVETLRAQQKQQSGRPSEGELQERARRKEEFQKARVELTELERRRKDLLDGVPNPPADDVPDGSENDFAVLREVGERPSFAFPARDHLGLAEASGWIDVARGTKVSGSRFAYRVADVACADGSGTRCNRLTVRPLELPRASVLRFTRRDSARRTGTPLPRAC